MIEYLVLQSLFWIAGALWWAVRLPFTAARSVYHGTGRFAGAVRLVTHDAIVCPSCFHAVSIVGRYRCGTCGYIFDGFAFARCAVCGAVPPYLPCTVCHAGLRNPIHTARLNR